MELSISSAELEMIISALSTSDLPYTTEATQPSRSLLVSKLQLLVPLSNNFLLKTSPANGPHIDPPAVSSDGIEDFHSLLNSPLLANSLPTSSDGIKNLYNYPHSVKPHAASSNEIEDLYHSSLSAEPLATSSNGIEDLYNSSLSSLPIDPFAASSNGIDNLYPIPDSPSNPLWPPEALEDNPQSGFDPKLLSQDSPYPPLSHPQIDSIEDMEAEEREGSRFGEEYGGNTNTGADEFEEDENSRQSRQQHDGQVENIVRQQGGGGGGGGGDGGNTCSRQSTSLLRNKAAEPHNRFQGLDSTLAPGASKKKGSRPCQKKKNQDPPTYSNASLAPVGQDPPPSMDLNSFLIMICAQASDVIHYTLENSHIIMPRPLIVYRIIPLKSLL